MSDLEVKKKEPDRVANTMFIICAVVFVLCVIRLIAHIYG